MVIEASVAASVHDYERADHRAEILDKALASRDATVEPLFIPVVVSEGLQPQSDTVKYRSTHISLPFRREDYQAAVEAVDAAIQAAVADIDT